MKTIYILAAAKAGHQQRAWRALNATHEYAKKSDRWMLGWKIGMVLYQYAVLGKVAAQQEARRFFIPPLNSEFEIRMMGGSDDVSLLAFFSKL